jgi:hypothetical protein
MKLKYLVWVFLALIVVVIVLPFTVYSIDETAIQFETISLQPDNLYSQVTSPKIQVIDNLSQATVPEISPADLSAIEKVDFARDFVIVAFFGISGSQQNSIASVKQFKSDVWVKCDIQATPASDVKYSSYQIINIARSQMPRTGALDFILLNNLYEEKSRAVLTISGDDQ